MKKWNIIWAFDTVQMLIFQTLQTQQAGAALQINFIDILAFIFPATWKINIPSFNRSIPFPQTSFANETAHLLMGLSQITRLRGFSHRPGLMLFLLAAGFHHLGWSEVRQQV